MGLLSCTNFIELIIVFKIIRKKINKKYGIICFQMRFSKLNEEPKNIQLELDNISLMIDDEKFFSIAEYYLHMLYLFLNTSLGSQCGKVLYQMIVK